MDAVSPFFALPEVPAKEKMLSIIIPVYNRKDLITETLDSILNQTRTDWECVVVDDGSDDGSEQIVGDYARKDSRIRLFRRPENFAKGQSGSRNYGLLQARGEYIHFFDSDDLLGPEFIETFLPPLEEDPELDFVNFRFLRFETSPQRVLRTSPRKPPDLSFVEAVAGLQMALGTQSFLWRKSFLDRVPEKWREDLMFGEDQEYYFRLLHEARKGVSFDEPILFYYRRNRSGICYRLKYDKRILADSYAMYKSKVETALRYGDGPRVHAALAAYIRKQMRLSLRFGDLEYLARFVRLSEALNLPPKEKKRIAWMRRHPFLGICRYRTFFLLGKLFSQTGKDSKK